MIARDGPFCVMGSGTPAGDCQAHHLDFFTDGGRTDLADGAHISKPIHHAIHHRGFTLARLEPGVYQLTAPDSRVWTSRITAWGASVTTNF